jgi:hypothetical protein
LGLDAALSDKALAGSDAMEGGAIEFANIPRNACLLETGLLLVNKVG